MINLLTCNLLKTFRLAVIGAALSLTACTVVEPPPQPVAYQAQPGAPVVYAAPPPAYYAPAYPGYYAPPVSVSLGFGGRRGYYGRGRW